METLRKSNSRAAKNLQLIFGALLPVETQSPNRGSILGGFPWKPSENHGFELLLLKTRGSLNP